MEWLRRLLGWEPRPTARPPDPLLSEVQQRQAEIATRIEMLDEQAWVLTVRRARQPHHYDPSSDP